MNRLDGWARQLSNPGELIASATVTVYAAGHAGDGGYLSTIYADDQGTGKANPFTTDAYGRWFFYAATGLYDVVVSGGTPACTTYTLPTLAIFDPSAAAAVSTTAVTVRGSASGTITLVAPSAPTPKTYTLPAADGTSGQVLTTNGSGVLSWTSKT